jgi:phage baseplate assembly protein W
MSDLGRDTLCIGSLRTGCYATGVRLVAQRLYHALSTPRGSLCGDEHHANWGDDLTDVVGMPGGAAAEARIRAKVARAASNDETIRSVSTTIASTQDADGSWSHAVTIDAVTAEGPFQLVVPSIADLTVAMLGFPEAAL